MAKPKKRPRGRPPLGGKPPKGDRHPLVGVRFPPELTAAIDHWAGERDLNRSEAVRQLVEKALDLFSQANRGKRK